MQEMAGTSRDPAEFAVEAWEAWDGAEWGGGGWELGGVGGRRERVLRQRDPPMAATYPYGSDLALWQ